MSARHQKAPIYRSRPRGPKPTRQRYGEYSPPPKKQSAVVTLVSRIATTLVVATVIVVLILGAGIAWTMEKSQFVNAQNIVFVKDQKDGSEAEILLAFFSGKKQEVIMAELNPSDMIPVLGGYGQYQLQAVNPLLKIDKKSAQFVNAAYSWGLGRTVDKVVQIPADSPLTVPGKQATVGQVLRELLFDHPVISSDWLELASMYVFVINADQANQPIEPLAMADVSGWPATFEQPPSCSIAVINTTPMAGVASEMSSQLEASQIRVIRVSDASLAQPATIVYLKGDVPECQPVLEHMQGMWPWELETKTDPQISNQYRADVVIMVGTDFSALLENFSAN